MIGPLFLQLNGICRLSDMQAHELKALQRQQAYQARSQQADREALSRIIGARFMALGAYRRAKTVMAYIGCKTEVGTQPVIGEMLAADKCVVIPYCTRDQEDRPKLGLWRLTGFAELSPGTWGILEPPKSRWSEPGREIQPAQLDLIMVPGVGFDRQGGRLGNGAGYYDRLLAGVRPDTVLCGICFESQLFDEIAMEPHDVAMDVVVTERAVYRGKGRPFSGDQPPGANMAGFGISGS
jgi:5-formyltetrahydrofolate cyclo-ligase